jgi:predicted RNA methylase
MGNWTNWIDNNWYAAYAKNWDDSLFRERILAHIQPDSVVLDLGAGAGIVAQMNFRGLAKKVCGVDLDPRVVENPMLDEEYLMQEAYLTVMDCLMSCFQTTYLSIWIIH